MRNLQIGWLVCLLLVPVFGLQSPLQEEWVELLVLLAAWVAVPQAVMLLLGPGRWRYLIWGGAALLSLSFLQAAGLWSVALALPWLLLSLWLLFRNGKPKGTESTLVAFAFLFWAVAGSWSVAHAAGWQPLGFSPVIVLLTAAHFHYAGFLLLALLALAYRQQKSKFLSRLGYFTIFSTGMVALSITVTRLGGPVMLETVSGSGMALAGGLLAWHYIRLPGPAKALRLTGGLLLLCGMLLALSYALRPLLAAWSLSIPQMYAWHGTGNALALLLLLQSWFFSRHPSYPQPASYRRHPARG